MERFGPWAGPAPQPLTFINRAWASLAPEALTFINRAWASPGPPTSFFYWRTPHFYRQALAQPGPQPLTSIGQTPHFYQPNPSLLSARPGRQLASDPNLSVDSCAARNPCVSKIDTWLRGHVA